MAMGLAALGLLAFLLGCPGKFAEPQNSEPAAKSSLIITWKNDLNSPMETNSVKSTSVFAGQYLKSPPSEAISVFAGQYLRDKNGEEQLRTTWLLREKVESAAEDWGATRVGTDTFYRTK
ncbi:avidin-like [Protobothrops mucrosquamatus]|uniref:avidin-like n=1 Tax=Protobothrops mucrosquamatus TaxID=103944 RepID=UPI0007757A1B|nr:avidin-like [Protobothrops mucrosquamatus]